MNGPTTITHATSQQQAELTALGVEVLARTRELIVHQGLAPHDATDDEMSLHASRLLVLAAFTAANDVEWFNRAHAFEGIGLALGETVAQWEPISFALLARLNEGLADGHDRAARLFAPRGRA